MENKPMHTKKQLLTDLGIIIRKASKRQYIFGLDDAFALGYMAAKGNLDNIYKDKTALKKACDKYDQTDDLGLLDTVSEVLMDLDILPGKKTE
jgi:hypothetical protein